MKDGGCVTEQNGEGLTGFPVQNQAGLQGGPVSNSGLNPQNVLGAGVGSEQEIAGCWFTENLLLTESGQLRESITYMDDIRLFIPTRTDHECFT